MFPAEGSLIRQPSQSAASIGRPVLVIICGLSFAGKSTLARAVCARFGWAEVDVDAVKARLHPDAADHDLTPEAWQALYAAADDALIQLLRRGACVVDASRNFTRIERAHAAQLAAGCAARLVTVYVDTPEPVARQRWLANCAHPVRRAVSPADFEAVIRCFEPPGADEAPLIYHSGGNPDSWLDRYAAAVIAP